MPITSFRSFRPPRLIFGEDCFTLAFCCDVSTELVRTSLICESRMTSESSLFKPWSRPGVTEEFFWFLFATSFTLILPSRETDFDLSWLPVPVLVVPATWMLLRLVAIPLTSLIWFFLMFIFATLLPLVTPEAEIMGLALSALVRTDLLITSRLYCCAPPLVVASPSARRVSYPLFC